MRVKTDARRKLILASAWTVFREKGFERAAMTDIAAEANCSKATVYGYFRSKQELFSSAIPFALSGASSGAYEKLVSPGALRDRLIAFARAHMDVRLSPDMLAADRIVAEAAAHTNLYEHLRTRSLNRRQRVADVLAEEMAAGTLRVAQPLRAALHFLGLIEFDLRDRGLMGDTGITGAMLDEQVVEGVDAFLRAYKPETPPRARRGPTHKRLHDEPGVESDR